MLPQVVERLIQAINDRNLDGLVGSFDEQYVNVTPVHPERSFQGSQQVRRNWSRILATVPNLRARVADSAVDGDRVWTEWEMEGQREDGAPFAMKGVVIFVVSGDSILSSRFYLEPVEQVSGDADQAVDRLLGDASDGRRD